MTKNIQIHSIEMVKVADLKTHPDNYRGHDEEQVTHIVTSIKEFGFYKNAVVANDNTLLAGHGVTEACKQLKLEKIPVVKLKIASDSVEAKKVLAADNEIMRLASVNDRKLTELLKEVSKMKSGLEGTGFDEQKLASLVFVTRDESEIKTLNEAGEWTGMPDFEPMEIPEKLTVNFETMKDKLSFAEVIKQKVTEKTNTVWWPPKGKDDVSALEFDE